MNQDADGLQPYEMIAVYETGPTYQLRLTRRNDYDLRIWFLGEDGRWHPSQRGMRLSARALKAIASGLVSHGKGEG